jgi:hypothetical protein
MRRYGIGLFAACGPKNNGRFGYMEDGRFRTGLTHRLMTKLARMAFLTMLKKGWRNA